LKNYLDSLFRQEKIEHCLKGCLGVSAVTGEGLVELEQEVICLLRENKASNVEQVASP